MILPVAILSFCAIALLGARYGTSECSSCQGMGYYNFGRDPVRPLMCTDCGGKGQIVI